MICTNNIICIITTVTIITNTVSNEATKKAIKLQTSATNIGTCNVRTFRGVEPIHELTRELHFYIGH